MARGAPRISPSDLAYAYECAADFLEMEEWPEDDGGAQVATTTAYRQQHWACSTGEHDKVAGLAPHVLVQHQ